MSKIDIRSIADAPYLGDARDFRPGFNCLSLLYPRVSHAEMSDLGIPSGDVNTVRGGFSRLTSYKPPRFRFRSVFAKSRAGRERELSRDRDRR